eukprot:Pgem_evm1s15214
MKFIVTTSSLAMLTIASAQQFSFFKNCNDSEPIVVLGAFSYNSEELRRSSFLGEDVEIRRIDIPSNSSVTMYAKENFDSSYFHRRE